MDEEQALRLTRDAPPAAVNSVSASAMAPSTPGPTVAALHPAYDREGYGGHQTVSNVNRVFLIGIVAAAPVDRDGECRLVVGIPQQRSGREWLERIDVVTRGRLAETARELTPAQPVYTDGRLVQEAGRGVVEASQVFALGDAPPPPDNSEHPSGSHASPRTHDRAGHPRRIHIGTARERVIWVRPTKVGRPGSPIG